MKKIYLSIFAIAAIFALACNKESVKDSSEAPAKGSVFTIKASMDEATKTAYAGGKVFSWAAGDEIAVEISDGQNADFATFSTSTSAAVADFSGEVPDYFRPYEYAVYPASINPTFLSNGLITVDLPKEYETRGLNDPLSILPLIAMNDGNGNYAFHHATGVLKVSFTNIPEGACELYLRANNQAISGSFYINLGQAGEDYAQYEQIIADGYWTNTGYLVTSVFFDRPSSGEASIYVPIPVGTLNAGLQISLLDESGSTLFSKTTTKDISFARKQIVELPVLDADVWQPLGTAKFNHIYFSGEYDYSVDVPIQYNTEDPNKFRLVNPYGILLSSLGITQASEPSEYLSFTLLQPGDKVYGTTITMNGLVDFDPVYTGYSANNYFMAHPSYLNGFDDEQQYIYNRVIKYQEDGKTPANIELDGHRLYYSSGSLYGSYCWNENLVMQIAFPGYDILDYSADIGAIAPNAASTAASPLIDAEIVFGADTEYALVAIAASEDDAFDAIEGGNGIRVNAAGIVTLSLPADSGSGNYFVAAISYAEGQSWVMTSKKFSYVNPNDALMTLDDILGTYNATATPMLNGSPSSFSFTIELSDDPNYDVMIADYFGEFPLAYANYYGTFDAAARTITWSDDVVYYDGTYIGCIENYNSPPYAVTYNVLEPGVLDSDQMIVIVAYNTSWDVAGYFRAWSDFSAQRVSSSSAPKPSMMKGAANSGSMAPVMIPSLKGKANKISGEFSLKAR